MSNKLTSKIDVSLKDLLEAGAHFGHHARRWNPKMKDYLYGVENKVHVFDLVQTKEALEEALEVIAQAASEEKTIILVGTKKQAAEAIEKVAKATGVFYVNQRWLGGTITNFDQIKVSTKKLTEMKKKRAEGGYSEFTKRERLLLDREIDRLQRFFGGIEELKKTPDLIFVVDTKRETGAITEANKMDIETVAIVDSNSDPTVVTYPIPMNDDATQAVEYVLGLVQQAIEVGQKAVKKEKVVKGGK